jgi:small ligand-binding sensory domain FIST
MQTFHVLGENMPENNGKKTPEEWKEIVGLKGIENDSSSIALIFPSLAFQPDLTKLLRGLEMHITPTVVGAVASTVSSLSRARLFRYSKADGTCIQTLADGCVGVILSGDIQVQTMVAQGAKPVSGVYQIVKGQESTIAAIALDEVATAMVQKDEGTDDDKEAEEQDDNSAETEDARVKLAQAYAKARIPKPVLAEANMLMRTLSDDDQAFMKTALLVGLERTGDRSPSDLVRLAEGKGPGFTVHQVASAGVKDGSVTFSLGAVNIKPGQRLRFYVREPTFAKKEARALWTGYNQRILKEGDATPFAPAGCFVFPTLDRGNKFFLGKSGFESSTVIECVPTVPSISGFFGNGVIARLDSDPDSGVQEKTSLSGSASGYFLFGSSKYIPQQGSA